MTTLIGSPTSQIITSDYITNEGAIHKSYIYSRRDLDGNVHMISTCRIVSQSMIGQQGCRSVFGVYEDSDEVTQVEDNEVAALDRVMDRGLSRCLALHNDEFQKKVLCITK
jgi:hypothetical protein